MLKTDHNGPLPSEYSGGVGQQRVQDPQIPRGDPRAVHDRELSGLLLIRASRGGDDHPLPDGAGVPPSGDCGQRRVVGGGDAGEKKTPRSARRHEGCEREVGFGGGTLGQR